MTAKGVEKQGLRVSLVRLDAGAAVGHGMSKLVEAMQAKGIAVEVVNSPMEAKGAFVIVPCVGGMAGASADLFKSLGVTIPREPESLCIHKIRRQGQEFLLAGGADGRGLMYGLLDLAERISWGSDPADPFGQVRDCIEKPNTVERALSKYTMHRATLESYFHDERYWERYFDLLAACRFNSFALLFGYENWGYFAPPYPYFHDTEGFPDIRVMGLDAAGQRRNLDSLRRIIDLAHQRGLNFTLGIWDHIYRGGIQGPEEFAKRPTPGLVWGLTEDNLVAYTKAALEKFLRLLPGIDALQFRMHGESGLTGEEMLNFWPDIYRIVQSVRPGIRFDARAKEYPNVLIDKALEMGLNFRVTTKYWCEQMGLPFHPTHIPYQNQFDRRHGYADLLRYPKRYPMHWRLWTSGTTRVLLWGDPEFAKRFVETTHLYDGEGFEVTEPMATKMQAHPHDQPPFELLNEPYRYYDYEFERYWYFFRVFGRTGYNPDASEEVWGQPFRRRLGSHAGPLLQQALHKASWILSRITTCIFPYRLFATTSGWAEKQRRGNLPDYAKAGVGDTQQFMTMEEAVANYLVGEESAKVHPLRTSRWFARVAGEVLDSVAQAEKAVGKERSREFVSTVTDLKILAHLAEYHSRRILAGLAFVLFDRTKSACALDDAITHEEHAIEAWQQLVDAAGDVYGDDIAMGGPAQGLSGHWRDELAEMRAAMRNLQFRKRQLGVADLAGLGLKDFLSAVPQDEELLEVAHQRITETRAAAPLKIAAGVRSPVGVKWVRLRYRGVNQMQDYRSLEMRPSGTPGRYEATVPAEHIVPEWDFMYFIEAYDHAGRGIIYPNLDQQTPYVIVRLQRSS